MKLIASGESRLFWVSVERPADENLLHSILPRMPTSRVDYEWSRDINEIVDFHFSDQIVVDCTFGTSRALRSASRTR